MAGETDQERTERYLKMATDTAALAQNAADASATEAYMNLANIWAKLADELLAQLSNGSHGRAPKDELRA